MAREIRIKGLSLYTKVKVSGLFFDLPKHGAGRSMDGLDWDDPAMGKRLIRHFLPPITNDPIPNFLSSSPRFVACGVMALYLHSP
jgi:hypothetical protein